MVSVPDCVKLPAAKIFPFQSSANAKTVLLKPLPNACQADPSRAAMRLAPVPPAVVKAPPATSFPEPSTSSSRTTSFIPGVPNPGSHLAVGSGLEEAVLRVSEPIWFPAILALDVNAGSMKMARITHMVMPLMNHQDVFGLKNLDMVASLIADMSLDEEKYFLVRQACLLATDKMEPITIYQPHKHSI